MLEGPAAQHRLTGAVEAAVLHPQTGHAAVAGSVGAVVGTGTGGTDEAVLQRVWD